LQHTVPVRITGYYKEKPMKADSIGCDEVYIITHGPTSEEGEQFSSLEEALKVCEKYDDCFIRRVVTITSSKDIYPGRIVKAIHDTYGKPRIYQLTPGGELDLLS
jgi:hypothetical protein